MDKSRDAALREFFLHPLLETADRGHVAIGLQQFLAAQLHGVLPSISRGAPILHARRRFHNPPPSTAAVQDFAEGDRAEPPDVDADVELPRLWLQPAVAVAVQVEPALAHATPAAKR